MPTVLVVDDEQVYREEIQFALKRDGYEVRTAGNGRSAVGLGACFRPNVLVADWMLKDHLHGLHVSEALRVIRPDMQTILITGFACSDLRANARRGQVFDFLEKPFETDHLRATVRAAAECVPQTTARSGIGVLDVDAAGSIVYANPTARDLLTSTTAGPNAERLDEVFPPDMLTVLNSADLDWVRVFPRSDQSPQWHVQTRYWQDTGNRLLILLAEEQVGRKTDPIVRVLLDRSRGGELVWPVAGRALVIDSDELVRQVAVTGLENIGCICHTAENREQAWRLFGLDPQIETVIVDFELPAGETADLVARLQAERPEVRIVGTGEGSRREDFARIGVGRFLAKPWTVSDLVDTVTS